VDSVLGPLPKQPSAEEQSAPVPEAKSLVKNRQPREASDNGDDDAEGAEGDALDQLQNDFDKPSGEPASRRKQAGQPAPEGGDSPGTWISVAGVGSWPQPDLAGFWRTLGTKTISATLVRTSPDGRHFDGYVVRDGKVRGAWLDMDRDGQSAGWKGKVLVAQEPNPPGYCPHWVRGALLIEPAAPIYGVWWSKRRTVETCKDTDEPSSGRFTLERVVLTNFQPLVPGKFIHLIGVPAGGSTSAQYQAGVEFRCDTSGLQKLTPKVSVSAGRVVDTGEACRYQLVVDKPGSYDITVEFRDADDKAVHTDRLRADVPPIPGLTG
jgi:hypothetical protein